MTTRRATDRRTSLEKNQPEVIALLLGGWKPAQVAEKYKVARSSVTKFIARHADKLDALYAEVQKRTEDYAIADNVRRIAALDEDWRALGAIQEARAADRRYDEPGYETGRMVHTLKSVGGGNFARIVDEYKVDTALIAERRNLVMAAAELLGQTGKVADTAIQINVFNRVRELAIAEGYDPDIAVAETRKLLGA